MIDLKFKRMFAMFRSDGDNGAVGGAGTGEEGFDSAVVKQYLEKLDSYVDVNICKPLYLGFKSIVEVDITRYWISTRANGYVSDLYGIMRSIGLTVDKEICSIKNKIINAYNIWATLNETSKMENVESIGVEGSYAYKLTIPELEFEYVSYLGSKNIMNKTMIRTSTIPLLNTIESNAEEAINGIPQIEGFYDNADAQSAAYDLSLTSMTDSIIDQISAAVSLLTTEMEAAIDDNTLAKEQAEKALNA